MSRRVLVLLVILLGLAALAGPLALVLGADRGEAAFGDSELFGLNQVASASVSVDVGANTLPVDATLLAPGDQLTGQLVLENTGSLPLRYAVVADVSADGQLSLLDVLEWRVWSPAGSRSCAVVPSTLLFDGVMDSEAVLGDVTPGSDAGDRLINSNNSDLLCIEIELPLGIADAYQSAEAVVRLRIQAEQAPEEFR